MLSLLVVISLQIYTSSPSPLNINLAPRRNWSFADGPRFIGNGTEFFRVLAVEGNTILVGAKDAVLNVSASDLTIRQQLDWPANDHDRKQCQMKGRGESNCHNFIRVVTRLTSGDEWLVCGTNAFKPTCREYAYNPERPENPYAVMREFNAHGIAPFDPRHNSSFYQTAGTDELYTGTVVDFAGTDALIYRKKNGQSAELRTARSNLNVLNRPSFIAMTEDEDHVYVWFREIATEYKEWGRRIFSRVGRVCKRDRGGSGGGNSNMEFTSFAKARLNCSISSDTPFYFDELQSVSILPDGLVYAVFTSPWGGLKASAICVYRMSDVAALFNNGNAKLDPNEEVPPYFTPLYRPGSCVKDSMKLPEEHVSFVKRNPLLEGTIDNLLGRPLIIDTTNQALFSSIAVSSNVRAVDSARFDVLYVGTDDGRVYKIVTSARQTPGSFVSVSESFTVFDHPVTELRIVGGNRLLAISENRLRLLPLTRCQRVASCSQCLALQDPHCAWDLTIASCVARLDGRWSEGHRDYIQAVEKGKSELCPEGAIDSAETFSVHEMSYQSVSSARSSFYSPQALAIAVVCSLLVALGVGCLVGYRLSTLRSATNQSSSSSLVSSHASPPSSAACDVYGSTPQHHKLNEAVSLVLSMQESKLSVLDRNHPVLLNNGTLPKDYKVKKVYL